MDPRNHRLSEWLAEFKRFKPGQSFFMPAATPHTLALLREWAEWDGVGIRMRYTRKDPIHKCPGTRVYREAGTYDEL